MAEQAKHPVSTSRKMIRFLEALHEHGCGGVTDVASAAGINKSTVHNHLSILRAENIIVREGNEYALGLRLLEFCGKARKDRRL